MNPVNIAIWLLGNLSLAFLPVALAETLARGLRRDLTEEGRVRWLVWAPLFLLWLLFLPNTCYLLTEWRHYLDSVSRTPAFYPIYHRGLYAPEPTLRLLALTLFYAVYSGLGLLALFLSIHPLARLAAERWTPAALRLAQAAVFSLCAVGVYLGLVNRFNSWDILRRHTAPAIFQALSDIPNRPALLCLLSAFAAFLWLIYSALDIWADGLALRFRAHRT